MTIMAAEVLHRPPCARCVVGRVVFRVPSGEFVCGDCATPIECDPFGDDDDPPPPTAS
jgi:hypothetical protein